MSKLVIGADGKVKVKNKIIVAPKSQGKTTMGLMLALWFKWKEKVYVKV